MNTFPLMCFKGFECIRLMLLMDISSNNNEEAPMASVINHSYSHHNLSANIEDSRFLFCRSRTALKSQNF